MTGSVAQASNLSGLAHRVPLDRKLVVGLSPKNSISISLRHFASLPASISGRIFVLLSPIREHSTLRRDRISIFSCFSRARFPDDVVPFLPMPHFLSSTLSEQSPASAHFPSAAEQRWHRSRTHLPELCRQLLKCTSHGTQCGLVATLLWRHGPLSHSSGMPLTGHANESKLALLSPLSCQQSDQQ